MARMGCEVIPEQWARRVGIGPERTQVRRGLGALEVLRAAGYDTALPTKVPRMQRALRILAFLCLAGLAAQGVRAQERRALDLTFEGVDVAADAWVPAGPPRGLAVIAHGFTRSSGRHADLGRDLARAGVFALVPNLPPDGWPESDAALLEAMATRARAGGIPGLAAGRWPVVFVGFSRGGLVALLAAAATRDTAGWVGLDPVDRGGLGARTAARLDLPAFALRAPPSACNAMGNADAMLRALPTLRRDEIVSGATHCDFESPTDWVCSRACGAADAGRQAAIRNDTVDAVLRLLP
jgi:hypothetical protein